ncbi:MULTISPECIES: hypothetical protein [unclassified Rhodococcus (in: high G+C Gram-positive bacteria)]|uniref:hypothetical protein n=1 Tax=unclassified Rhodococcus (in: high G+C Gram-positive bacteria) TaxID=192944 RepID=UPI00163AD675|nr:MULTISPECIES: hypothetical protein [unclassified Rhodococcus (in: high G+C Gram-positive bacteria)]MBC2642373.1 hypothetical protein [Rhodococcus sp. 3A]MBC2892884.1 hypothetical protein [Rhodococcus sp. 4CII]
MIPALFAGLCDDAALFPPGNAPLPDAVPAHARHRSALYADLVGPFVFPVDRLNELASGPLELSLTLPGGPATLEPALERLAQIDGARAVALEIAVPAYRSAAEFFAAMDAVAALTGGVDVFVEVPRGERRADFVDALAGGPFAAKFRTGGVAAEAYPDETELGSALRSVIASGVPFKATAGLHHAVRNTDPHTGFEQHGFLNVLLATRYALDGAGADRVAAVLAERDGARIARELGDLPADVVGAVRTAFRSFGTCSILEPLEDLVALHLVPNTVLASADQGAHA